MASTPALGVYVHWPYCARICPYCDFNVYKNRDIDAARWLAALTRDLDYWAGQIDGRPLTSLYFGGGTPSLAPPEIIEGVIAACENLWGFEPDAEITLEANPTDAEQSRFEEFSRLSVNRLSLGVQSLRDDALKFLGRDHNAAEAQKAIETANEHFPRVSFDLIYARPGQTAAQWRRELDEALALSPSHLSLYQLTIASGTAFDKAVARGAWAPATSDACADFYELTQEMTGAAGLPAYEISSHAAPGDPSRHNMIYWRQHDYIGVGPGAHGRLSLNGERIATETHKHPSTYLDAVNSTGNGASAQSALDDEARLVERVSMGLRMTEGIRFDAALRTGLGERIEKLTDLINDGLICENNERLAATPHGRRVLDGVIRDLLT